MANDLKVTLSLVDDFTRKLTGVEAHLGAFGQKIDNINRIASRFGLGLGLGFAGFQIKDQIEGLINEAKEYTQTQNQLRESLGYTSIALNEQADVLESKFKVDDNEILKLQSQISLYSSDEKMIMRLTEATINYAAAKGKTLQEATQAVLNGIVSETGAVRGLTGRLDGTAQSSERLGAMTRLLTTYFGGQADAVAASKNVFDDLNISIGNVRETIARGIFGSKEDKELMRYLSAKRFIELTTAEEAKASVAMQANYQSELNIVKEYEKKIADEKDKAREGNQARAMQSLSLTPGFKNKEEYRKAMEKQAEERRKAREKEMADEKRFYEEHPGFGPEGTTNFAAQMASPELKIKEEEQKKREEIQKKRMDLELEIEQFMNEGKERQKKTDERQFELTLLMIEREKQARIAAARSMVSNLGMVAEKWHEFGNLYKAAAITETTIDSIAAAQASYKAMAGIPYVGPALGVVAAGAALAAGMARVSMISSQSFSVGTRSAPEGPAFLHKDELVYLPSGSAVKTASETRQIVNNNTGGHTIIMNNYDSSGTLVESMTAQIRAGNANVDRLMGEIMKRAGVN